MKWGYLFLVLFVPVIFLQGMEHNAGDALSTLFTQYHDLRKVIIVHRLHDALQESKFEEDKYTLKLVSKAFYNDLKDPRIVESFLQDPIKAKKLLNEQLELTKSKEFDVDDINKKINHSQFTLLVYAANHGLIKWARYALAIGADVNAADLHGSTALHEILRGYHTPSMKKKFVELCLGYEARLDLADRGTGYTVLAHMLEEYQHYTDVLDKLSQQENWHKLVNMRCGTQVGYNAPLICWLLNKCKKIADAIPAVRLLIDHGVDLELRDSQDQTALMLVLYQRPHIELIRLLISAGADVNAAYKYSHGRLLDELLRFYGDSLALMSPARKEAMRTVILNGAEAITPYAKRHGMCFLRGKEDLKELRAWGKSFFPMGRIQALKKHKIILDVIPLSQLLIELIKLGCPCDQEKRSNRMSFINHVIKSGVNVTARDTQGYTALMRAAEHDDFEAYNLLAHYSFVAKLLSPNNLTAADIAKARYLKMRDIKKPLFELPEDDEPPAKRVKNNHK